MGETMTGAVTEAIQERVARVKGERAASLADRLMTIGKDCGTRLKQSFRSTDHGKLLYDERGLPR
jgi:antitoxin VapB